jgi:hypothetical protein
LERLEPALYSGRINTFSSDGYPHNSHPQAAPSTSLGALTLLAETVALPASVLFFEGVYPHNLGSNY